MKTAKTCCCALAVTLCAAALASAKMPIIGWGSWDEKGASAERYAEARDAGFTHLTQWCTSPAEAKRLLGEAEKAGIKLIIGLGHDVKRMTDAAKEFTAAAKDSPALEYYYITDEPHIRKAEVIRDCVKLYEELDPAHPCYVNLFGALYDLWTRNDVERQMKFTGCATHDEYIRRLYDVVPLKMISFDVYPVLSFKQLEVGDFRLHGQRVFLKERWYETLETTSALARERNIPMFAFALVAAHRLYPAQDYPVPTRAHLRLQHYSNLAYGAQALQCFKYAMRKKEYLGFNNAPILVGGRRSPVFDLVREMNAEIQARAYVFLGAKVQGVWHTGIDVPLGTKRFDAKFLPPFVKSFKIPNGGTAVVSWLKNGDTDYLMVVNRDPNDDITFKATFVDGTEIVRRDGTKVPAAAYADYFWLDPGDAAIFSSSTATVDENRAVWLDKISFEPVRDRDDSLAIIPAPQKVVRTKGECRTKHAPKFEKVATIPPEGYEISITKNGVTVRCSDDAGAFYAKMTLAQIEKADPKSKVKTFPCVEIVDAPKFKWRGVLIDPARHFLAKSAILRIIDEMSWYKLNVLQIHFTDNDAWTIEIPEFPELVKEGVNKGRSGVVYGEKVSSLYYSTKDIQEIVAYAAARHIKVVPEIEMPGHFGAAVRAYPSMKCKCPGSNVFCIGNPETVRFAEKVLDRVCELFQSDVIHFGGDECTRKFWKECPVCQAHIKREGLKGVEEIQPWLTRHLVEYLAKKGRRAIGWDEIFLASSWEKWEDFKKAGGDSFNSLLPKTTMGMCWLPWGAGALAANRGYEIVRCPTSYCYFDYRQGLAEDPFPYFGGRHVPLDKVYCFDVLEGVDDEARKNVVGGQCCNWGEKTPNATMLEWKLWPRALALSEVLWTYPDPKKRDFAEFSQRAAVHRKRLIRSGVNCAPLK